MPGRYAALWREDRKGNEIMSKYEIILGIILGIFILVYLFVCCFCELYIIDKLKTSISILVFGISFAISCLTDVWFSDTSIAYPIIFTFFDIAKHIFAIDILLLCIKTFLAIGWKDD